MLTHACSSRGTCPRSPHPLTCHSTRAHCRLPSTHLLSHSTHLHLHKVLFICTELDMLCWHSCIPLAAPVALRAPVAAVVTHSSPTPLIYYQSPRGLQLARQSEVVSFLAAGTCLTRYRRSAHLASHLAHADRAWTARVALTRSRRARPGSTHPRSPRPRSIRP